MLRKGTVDPKALLKVLFDCAWLAEFVDLELAWHLPFGFLHCRRLALLGHGLAEEMTRPLVGRRVSLSFSVF